ncbi:MAG TPA: hypothetical protein VMT70_22320 [Vicinamibacteria bacterium]|nr:hypothetical protein [Vicinamibacteria bacterium]
MSGAAEGLGAALRRGGRFLSRTLVEPPLPLVAVEVRPGAVAAVRLVREGGRLALGAAGAVDLPPGVVSPSLTKANLLDGDGFRAVLRAALERVGALAGGAVSLVLPDPVVRLTLVSSAGLHGRRAEVDETVRFRLHKTLPSDFDVRTARVAWQAVGGEQLLVAAAADEVVRGYEDALAGLGLHAGLVEPAGLALATLDGAGTAGDRLLVNWDEGYVSFFLSRGPRPLLLRTLPREGSPEAVARQASQTARFHRDQLGGGVLEDVALRSAAVPSGQAVAVLEEALGVAPRLLRPWAALGVDEDGAAAQAVAGAAACVLRRAA